MIAEEAPQLCVCGSHEIREVAEIGNWLHGYFGARRSCPKTVQEIVATEPIWENADLTREDLTARILTAGRITCEFALKAMAMLDGRVDLSDGVHRWAVCTELGIRQVPVKMIREEGDPAWAWVP